MEKLIYLEFGTHKQKAQAGTYTGCKKKQNIGSEKMQEVFEREVTYEHVRKNRSCD